VANEVNEIEGWSAVASVAGAGAVLMLVAGTLWFRSLWLPDARAEQPTYRSKGSAGSHEASDARAMALILVALCVVTQLLYVGMYWELALRLRGGSREPRVVVGLLFWVLLVDGTSAVGALLAGWGNRNHPQPSRVTQTS